MQLENIQKFVLVLLYGGLTLLSFTILIKFVFRAVSDFVVQLLNFDYFTV